jgi:NADPH2 dehydrogenase
VASFGTAAGFQSYTRSQGLEFPCDAVVETGTMAPLARPMVAAGRTLNNRFCVLPMEGWDGTTDGRPSDNTRRRWRNFGRSGAKLIWGGEAVAVRPDGRANPRQLCLTEDTEGDIAALREGLIDAHRDPASGNDRGDLLIGLQLTHSGRFCRPNPGGAMQPAILYRHPILDRKFGLPDDYPVMSDDEIERLIADFVAAAKRARRCGYDFVDVKHCHGYLGHEFLSAVHRPGRFGGSLENRTRFLREIVAGIRAEAPGLAIGVRLSAIDLVPFRPDPAQSSETVLGPGVPEGYDADDPYDAVFGARADNPTKPDMAPCHAFCTLLEQLGITLLNVTAGSPYYNPHVTRPALYPPSDGYRPPEEPLAGVLRLLHLTRDIKQRFPGLVCVGSGYTYLQEFLPNVAQAAIRAGWTDFVGLGRMVLTYPELPRDVLANGAVTKKRLCRSFSDCTTAPRNGLVSGCYPLDLLYKKSPEARTLAEVKKAARLA